MIAIPLLALVLVGSPQDPSTPAATSKERTTGAAAAPGLNLEQQPGMKQKGEQVPPSREPARQEAVRINDLAASIHNQADARKLVNAVAVQLTHHKHLFWAGQKFRHRVAQAEFEAVAEGALVSEDRIVGVWNEYVREIGAPEETVITAEELHKFRLADFHLSQHNWDHELLQSIWTMPNIYSTDSTGGLAAGCRALESLKLMNNIHEQFSRVHFARANVQNESPTAGVQGRPVLPPNMPPIGRRKATLATITPASGMRARSYHDPVRPAVLRYQQERGQRAYEQLVRRLFDELFPPE